MRAVLAYFPSSQQAQQVAEILTQQGYETQIDSVHKYPGEGVTTQMNPLTGRFASLTTMTLGLDADDLYTDDDHQYLGQALAADPAASGMAGSPEPQPIDQGHWQLMVVVKDDADAEKVNRICAEHGALF
ncbi:MAG: hypothetical protein GX058_02620 [Firmicutes bacterium]|nr:hypothetical protein [Bacillota bacterium]